jgi:conjugal transfer ATP-binding protein TraC
MLQQMFAAFLKRHRWSSVFPPVACYENKTFYLEDTKSNAYLGAVFFGLPLYGADDSTVNRLKSVMSTNFPSGTIIQFSLLAHSDVLDDIELYEDNKRRSLASNDRITQDQKTSLWEGVSERAAHFRRGVEDNVVKGVDMRLTKQVLIVSMKVPVPTSPSDKDFDDAEEAFRRVHDGMNTVGMRLRRGDKSDYLALTRACIQPDKPLDFGYEKGDFIRDQILPPGFIAECSDQRTLNLNGLFAKILSVKRLPSRANLALMNFITGDPEGLNNQIAGNYLASYTLHFPDQIDIGRKVRGRYGLLVQQASGNLGRWIPRLLFKKAGFDVLMGELDQGGMLCEAQLNLTVFSRSKDEVEKAASVMSTYLSSFRLELVPDSLILLPLFTNNLPLFPSPTSTAFMRRFRTMTVNQAVCFAPVVGESAGGNPVMVFSTQKGQVCGLDLYESNTNYNAIVFAESGAGKSFLTQQIISDYLAEGATIWVTDIGRSYQKLCSAYSGEFIEFSDESNICLNPFSNVVNIDEELDLLGSILAKMAAPNEGLDDYQSSRLLESIKAVFMNLGNDMTVTDVASYLQGKDDERMRDIGTQLFAFTVSGPFGHWFHGRNNLNFNSNFVVLELEELNGKPVLQQVVLMLLMAKIQHEMYLSGDGLKKIWICDESWAMFSDPGVAKFMVHGYRRFRKYNGAAILVLQNILDFYRTPGMESIAENSAHKLILSQQSESIDAVVDQKKINLDGYGRIRLKGVHTRPSVYSQIMHITNNGWRIMVLAVPRYTQVLYSTKGAEMHEILRAIGQGIPLPQAIRTYISERG